MIPVLTNPLSGWRVSYPIHMIPKSEAKEFLTSRRARLTPEQVGLPSFGINRRVSGLRREEVAMLAGVSVDYYIKLERGNLAGASSSVLGSLANALRLSDTERTYLFTLAAAGAGSGVKKHEPEQWNSSVSPALQRTIDQMSNVGIYVRNSRLEVLTSNAIADRIFPWLRAEDGSYNNIARFTFLDPTAKDFFASWAKSAADAVLILRMRSVNSPQDRVVHDLIRELSTKSKDFRDLWSANEFQRHQIDVKHFNHPTLGRIDVDFQLLTLADQSDLTMLIYSADETSETYSKLFT